MGKYRPGNTKKRQKDAEQHVLRDSSKGTHYIYNAREKERRADGPPHKTGGGKGKGESRKTENGKQETENRKQKTGNRKQKTGKRKE